MLAFITINIIVIAIIIIIIVIEGPLATPTSWDSLLISHHFISWSL